MTMTLPKINTDYQLKSDQGDNRQAVRLYVIAHDTANDNNNGTDSAKNEAVYMSNHWQSAYTHLIAGHDQLYQIKPAGYIAWGALAANPYAPMQIELSHYADKALALKAYQNWVHALRYYAIAYDIPLTLDAGGAGTPGIKSHLWVSKNIGGNHTDPYAYLTTLGISKEQFANDLKNGFNEKVGVDMQLNQMIQWRDPSILGVAWVVNSDGAKIYTDATGQHKKAVAPLKQGTAWQVSAIDGAFVKVGGYVSVGDVALRINTGRQTGNYKGMTALINTDTWLYDKKGRLLRKLKKGSTWLITGNNKISFDLGAGQYVKMSDCLIRL